MGTRFTHSHDDFISEINITPFVDVMLVLLIIFMISAPMMTNNMEVNLPKGGSLTNKASENIKRIDIFIKENGHIVFNHQTYLDASVALKEVNKTIKQNKLDENYMIYIMGDARTRYQNIIQVMAPLKQSGINKMVLVTKQDD